MNKTVFLKIIMRYYLSNVEVLANLYLRQNSKKQLFDTESKIRSLLFPSVKIMCPN
jgi:hypothetical protein